MGVPGASAPPGGMGEWFRGAGGLRLRAGTQRSPQQRGNNRKISSDLHSLTPPIITPLVKYFCINGNISITGMIDSTMMAPVTVSSE